MLSIKMQKMAKRMYNTMHAATMQM